MVLAPRSQAPIVINTPRPVAVPKKKKSAGRRRAPSDGGGTSGVVQFAMGGAALALIEKSKVELPTIPLLGKKGTLGVAAYFVGKHSSGMVRTVAHSMVKLIAGMAAYEAMKEGKISGDSDDDDDGM